MAKSEPTSPENLRQLLRLDPETGRLYWLWRGPEWFNDGKRHTAAHIAGFWNSQNADREAMTIPCSNGYRSGRIFDVPVLAHRVVFAMIHGEWPVYQIDHINGIRDDNRPINLREATNLENCLNRGSRGGSSQFCGVSWENRRQRWAAYAKAPSARRRFLGYFSDEADAAHAYDAFAQREHGEFARLNFPT